ncbi:MAG TPA: hypothetical protein VJ744_04340, partial [Gaiellaceae bacterium]|nr:hypothetical protein [Gaiellaceae bacterium]
MPERLAALIRENGPCVVLTGAGASTNGRITDDRRRLRLTHAGDERRRVALNPPLSRMRHGS